MKIFLLQNILTNCATRCTTLLTITHHNVCPVNFQIQFCADANRRASNTYAAQVQSLRVFQRFLLSQAPHGAHEKKCCVFVLTECCRQSMRRLKTGMS